MAIEVQPVVEQKPVPVQAAAQDVAAKDATAAHLQRELLHHRNNRLKVSNELVKHPIGYQYDSAIRDLVQKAKFHHGMMKDAQRRLQHYEVHGVVLQEVERGDIEQMDDLVLLKKMRLQAKQNMRRATKRKNPSLVIQRNERKISRIENRINELKDSS